MSTATGFDVRHPSRTVLDGRDRTPTCALLKATGHADDDFAMPLVGVIHSLAENDAVQLQPTCRRRRRQAQHPPRPRHADGDQHDRGFLVGYVCPEAAEGGPIAVARDGDVITIDLSTRAVDVEIPAQDLSQRLARWTPPEPRSRRGVYAKYAGGRRPRDRPCHHLARARSQTTEPREERAQLP